MSSLRAFGGGPLCGDRLLRMAFLDESGISKHEPFAVVAAAIIPGDHYKAIERGISDLADHCAPPALRQGFIFHAKELYHGGKAFPRDKYPKEYSREFLKYLLHIPKDNGIPISMGWIEKSTSSPIVANLKTENEKSALFHAMAFMNCVVCIDRLMRESYPDELVQLVAEDNTDSRANIKKVYNLMKMWPEGFGLSPEIQNWLPIRHVIDSVHFADKTESSPLQLADASAFAIRRHLERREDAAEYYDLLIPALVVRPKSDGSFDGWG